MCQKGSAYEMFVIFKNARQWRTVWAPSQDASESYDIRFVVVAGHMVGLKSLRTSEFLATLGNRVVTNPTYNATPRESQKRRLTQQETSGGQSTWIFKNKRLLLKLQWSVTELGWRMGKNLDTTSTQFRPRIPGTSWIKKLYQIFCRICSVKTRDRDSGHYAKSTTRKVLELWKSLFVWNLFVWISVSFGKKLIDKIWGFCWIYEHEILVWQIWPCIENLAKINET